MDHNMQGNSNGSHASKCGGCSICDGAHGGHHWMHLVVKIAIAIFIFWCGVQFGELKTLLRSAYPGYAMMGGYGEYGETYKGTMMGRAYSRVVAPVVTSTSTKSK